MKLIALKRLHYPSGPAGKEYKEGDAFEALSERDAKALKLIRKAKAAPAVPTQRRRIVDLPPEAMKPEPVEAKALEPLSTESAGALSPRGQYQRRDMKAEE